MGFSYTYLRWSMVLIGCRLTSSSLCCIILVPEVVVFKIRKEYSRLNVRFVDEWNNLPEPLVYAIR